MKVFLRDQALRLRSLRLRSLRLRSGRAGQVGQALRYNSGQAGLIVLLLTVVLLTIGISIASRATTDLTLSRQEEESNRAFNAAESGVEEALTQNLNFSGSVLTGPTYTIDDFAVNYSIAKINILETRLFEGVSAQVDVNGVTTGRGILVQWADEATYNCNTDQPASLLVTIFNQNGSTMTARSAGYRPCNTPSNGFQNINSNPGGSFYRQVTINLQTNDKFVRIKPLYSDTTIRVQGSGWTLPTQYYQVNSTADSSIGNEVRSVQVNRTLPVAPAIFDYVLFSGNTLVK